MYSNRLSDPETRRAFMAFIESNSESDALAEVATRLGRNDIDGALGIAKRVTQKGN